MTFAVDGITVDLLQIDFPEIGVMDETGIIVIPRDVPQSTVFFGHTGIKRNDPDWYISYVLNSILGGSGFSSRIMDEVRSERGLAYSVYTYLRPYENGGLYLGSVGTENSRVAESIDAIIQEIENFRDDGVSEEELADAKNYITGSYALYFDTSSKIAGQLVAIQQEDLGIDYIELRSSYIESITTEQIMRVAGRLLQPDQLLWVVVGDPAGLDSAIIIQDPLTAQPAELP